MSEIHTCVLQRCFRDGAENLRKHEGKPQNNQSQLHEHLVGASDGGERLSDFAGLARRLPYAGTSAQTARETPVMPSAASGSICREECTRTCNWFELR